MGITFLTDIFHAQLLARGVASKLCMEKVSEESYARSLSNSRIPAGIRLFERLWA